MMLLSILGGTLKVIIFTLFFTHEETEVQGLGTRQGHMFTEPQPQGLQH